MELHGYKPIHFCTQELVDQMTFLALGEKALELLDWHILHVADCLREIWKVPLIINNWHLGGERQISGYRAPECCKGAQYSQHKMGRALDIISPNMSAKDMRLSILEMNRIFPYITYMEDGVDWLHIDCRNSNHKGINLFKRGKNGNSNII